MKGTGRLMAQDDNRWTAPALVLAIGLLGGGWFIGDGFEEGRSRAATVTVKGLAERFVRADLAVWPLRFTATGNDLERVQGEIDEDVRTVSAFLRDAGLPEEAVQPQRVEVTDVLAQPYRPEGGIENRFIIAQTVLVRTEQVDVVEALGRRTGELVSRGVVLVDSGGPTYLFTRLNEIKPEMLADATRNAREAAEQFADDADAGIDGIASASQGLFQILARDDSPMLPESAQVEKKIRVVSTIEYRLDE